MFFSKVIQLCNHSHNPVSEHVHHLQRVPSSLFADYYFIASLLGISDSDLDGCTYNEYFLYLLSFLPRARISHLFPRIFCRVLFPLIFLLSLHLKGLRLSTDDRIAFDIHSMSSLAFNYIFWVQYFGPFEKQSFHQ